MREVPPFSMEIPPFVDLLKEPEKPVIKKNVQNKSSLALREGILWNMEFPDPENLLETAVDSLFTLFPHPGTIPVELKEEKSLSGEDHKILVTEERVLLSAGTLEGARRALYTLKSRIASCGYCLPYGEEFYHSFLKHRISRCFFGPIKRPPHNIDELMNEIDYYPCAYLDRLAGEGVNGLWLTITFREICKTSFYPESPDAERRRNKLRKTVEKCRRYGIKIWIFGIEPASWKPENPCPFPEMKSLYTESPLVCPASEATERYLYEATRSIFEEIPHLGGLITISHGERPTTCLSGLNACGETRKNLCEGNCSLDAADLLAKTLIPMVKGMQAAAPDAELISWLYMPYQQTVDEWIYKLPEKLNEKIILAYNFESGVVRKQLGNNRCGGDYWLSAAGPADRFGRMAAACKGRCRIGAKIQTCSSHELSTIPYIPVPGQLYKKYKAMSELGVSAVIQCWYFGNYPGTMSRAAGNLAFTDFNIISEDEFLKRLAAQELPDEPEKLVKAWKAFAEAYSNFPLDICFQYYSPVQDGPVWPLHLRQKMTSLPRTWKPDEEPAGDVISECFRNHTMEEVTILLRDAANGIRSAFEEFRTSLNPALLPEGIGESFSLYEAFTLLFESGANILEFYRKRALLFDSPPDASLILEVLEKIVHKEIRISERLKTLCEEDPRLGYHSEAETYKYFPAKLQWRKEALEELLATEFAQCREALAKGVPSNEWIALDFGKSIPGELWHESDSFRWKIEPQEYDYMLLSVECDGTPGKYEEMLNCHFCDRTGTKRPRWVQIDRWEDNGFRPAVAQESLLSGWDYEDLPDKYRIRFRIPRHYFSDPFFFSIRRTVYIDGEEKIEFDPPPPENMEQPYRLEQLFFHPEAMVSVKLGESNV